ncbi:unnamed protein product [Amoebophrya sp. A25]|nr:unnamed protein product [Amoebophrya sp. A25]|eukprot:GSA25T00004211001.1
MVAFPPTFAPDITRTELFEKIGVFQGRNFVEQVEERIIGMEEVEGLEEIEPAYKLDLSFIRMGDAKVENAVTQNRSDYDAQVRKRSQALELRQKAGKAKEFAEATQKRKQAKLLEDESDERKGELIAEMKDLQSSLAKLPFHLLATTWHQTWASSSSSSSLSENEEPTLVEVDPAEADKEKSSSTETAMDALQKQSAPGAYQKMLDDEAAANEARDNRAAETAISKARSSSQHGGLTCLGVQPLSLSRVFVLNLRACGLRETGLDHIFAAILETKLPLHALCLDCNPIGDTGVGVVAQFLSHTSAESVKRAQKDKVNRVKRLGSLHTGKMDKTGEVCCETLVSLSCHSIDITDDGFSTLIAAVAKAGPRVQLLDMRCNAGVTNTHADREIAVKGMRIFNKTCKILH